MIQNVKLKKGQVITKPNIKDILDKARQTYDYAKFTLYDGRYINLHFNRDFSIDIMTNDRDLILWREIESLKLVYTQARLEDFLFRWLNKMNR